MRRLGLAYTAAAWRAAKQGIIPGVCCRGTRGGAPPERERAADVTSTLRIAIIGDAHGQFNDDDNAALAQLAPDLALFVGDFGDEDADVVAAVARCAVPKATIFGNHDCRKTMRAWRGHHASTWYRSRGALRVARAVGERPTFSSESLEALHVALDDADVGYGFRTFDDARLAIVGARPFSRGGHGMYKQKFYKHHWRVRSLDESAARVAAAARASLARLLSSTAGNKRRRDDDDAKKDDAQASLSQVAPAASYAVLAHNGPAGLGSDPTSICGKDWGVPARGDWGDSDLARALRLLENRPPLFVAFGHMHSPARDGRPRTALVDDGNTLHVNAAVFPRWRRWKKSDAVVAHGFDPPSSPRKEDPSASASPPSVSETTKSDESDSDHRRDDQHTDIIARHFTLVDLEAASGTVSSSPGGGDAATEDAWRVAAVTQQWVLPSGDCVESRQLWPPQEPASESASAEPGWSPSPERALASRS